ncbi:S9 family peptidase, partial [candidate division KSB1 bacterium]|nr:S9 family peptidase [candidate division KSB1 bacterium]
MVRNRSIKSVLPVMLLLLFALAAHAQQQTLTPETVVALKSVSSVAIDPTGKNIVYILRAPRAAEEETGAAFMELFVIPVSGGVARQFTYKPNGVSSLQWSPDGKWIYFAARRKEKDEHNEVYRIAVDGGEAEQVSQSSNGVRQYLLSPDGKWIAYAMSDAQNEAEKKAAKLGNDVNTVDKNFKHYRLYVQAVGGSAAKMIGGEMSVWEFEWSPDASQLVFQASPTPRTDDSYMFKKLYLVARDGSSAPKILTKTDGKLGHLAWSPDGKMIAYNAGVDETDPAAGSIFVVPATGGAAKNLSENYEGTVLWVDWLDNATLVFTATERSHTALNTMPATGGARKAIISSGYAFSTASTTADGKTFALAMSAFNHTSEAFVGNFATKKVTRLTASNPELDQIKFAGAKEISWKAKDGLEITGLLMLPHDYQTGKKYPCIVQIHGGPESAYVE